MSISSTTGTAGRSGGPPSTEDQSAVQQGVETAKEHAGATVEAAKQEAASVAGSAVEHARTVLHSAGDELQQQSRSQTDRLGEMLGQASQDFERMAQECDSASPAGRTVRTLADATGQVAHRLEQGGPEGVMSDVSRFARRRPGMFLMLSAAAGFAVARLARSSDTAAIKDAVQRGASPENGASPDGSTQSGAAERAGSWGESWQSGSRERSDSGAVPDAPYSGAPAQAGGMP